MRLNITQERVLSDDNADNFENTGTRDNAQNFQDDVRKYIAIFDQFSLVLSAPMYMYIYFERRLFVINLA